MALQNVMDLDMERTLKKAKTNTDQEGRGVVVGLPRDVNGDAPSRPKFADPMVVRSKPTNVLEIEQMVAIEINSRYCGILLPLLSADLPLPAGMSHAKRVKKVDGGRRVHVLLEPSLCQGRQDNGNIVLTDAAKNILCTFSASVGDGDDVYQLCVKDVPRHGPTDATIQSAWSKDFWPVSIRAPDKMGKKEGEVMDPNEVEKMKEHMTRLWELSEASKRQGGGCNACIIVNPLTNVLVGSGVDESRHHPLKHPVLNAVQEVAAWQVLLWYQDLVQYHKCFDDGNSPLSSTMKLLLNTETALDTGDKAGHLHLPPYLCTGYDCYVFREPCAMCAMALVHSRLRRIVFCEGDESSGMLGGSGVRLHSLKSLNHHFVVYQMPMTD